GERPLELPGGHGRDGGAAATERRRRTRNPAREIPGDLRVGGADVRRLLWIGRQVEQARPRSFQEELPRPLAHAPFDDAARADERGREPRRVQPLEQRGARLRRVSLREETRAREAGG